MLLVVAEKCFQRNKKIQGKYIMRKSTEKSILDEKAFQ